ncbi:hypothetical protein Golob_022173, partial [Gossypium lobatum]|nr:hypothetical protein [Gossypium lobatum]
MDASGGDDRERRDEISLLAEELVQLSVKGSMVVPSSKPTLICTVAGQNLFLIIFEMEDDLELILEGRPWLFRKSLILFDRLCQAVERDQIRLISSPFWIKIETCFLEIDKKDLLHAIGGTFGGVLRSEISEEFCRLRINLDVQKPLRRGIFAVTDYVSKKGVQSSYTGRKSQKPNATICAEEGNTELGGSQENFRLKEAGEILKEQNSTSGLGETEK